MPRRKKVSSAGSLIKKSKSYKTLICSRCGEEEVRVDEDVESVIGSRCAVHFGPKLITPQEKTRSNKPRGWKLYKQFVDVEGNVYEYGEEKPDLKGTLPPTVVKKLSKFEREQKRLKKIQKQAKAYKRKRKQ